MQYSHQNHFAHSSNGDRALFIDYCFLKCTAMRLERPSLFIKSQWIRPEDIAEYESMGYTKFKLLERDIPSDDLIARVDAYSRRQSPQDLSELLIPYGFKKQQRRQPFWFFKYFLKPFSINPAKLQLLRRLAGKAGMLYPAGEKIIRILSSELPPDFITSLKNHPCPDCRNCTYCDTIATRAIQMNERPRQELLSLLQKLDQQLVTGSLWNV